MQRVSLQAAFILHQREYRDTSLLLDVFSEEHGRVGLVARGARGRRSPLRGLLQVFRPLLLSWSGRGELASLTAAESAGPALALQGETVFSGFYLNELLMRLLTRHDPHAELFPMYARTLQALATGGGQRALRLFEKRLLEELGYALQLDSEADSGALLQPDRDYVFYLERGPVAAVAGAANALCFSGRSLLSLHHEQLDDEQSLRDARRLMRAALALYLGDRPLKTREVLRQMSRQTDVRR